MNRNLSVISLFLVLSLKLAHSSAPLSVDYLYIDAGEGDSSGGHAAIRFGPDTFHFQYANGGLLRAVRDDSAKLEFNYRFLRNRTVYVSPIEVDASTYGVLRDYFNHRYLVQTQQFALLDAVKADGQLIESLLRYDQNNQTGQKPNTLIVDIRAAGLFFSETASTMDRTGARSVVLQGLTKRLAKSRGTDFIAQKQASIQYMIQSLKPVAWNRTQFDIDENRFPTGVYAFANRFTDLQTNWLALQVLRFGRSVRSDSKISMESAEFQLEPAQIDLLDRYARKLRSQIIDLIDSDRPDWGFALLVAMARLQVLQQSIETGRLVFVDTFQRAAEVVDPVDLNRYRRTFRSLLSEARADFLAQKTKIFSAPMIEERVYSHFESMANLYAELALGLRNGRPIRIFDSNLVPVRQARVSTTVLPKLERVELRTAKADAIEFQSFYTEAIANLYPYDLLTRNCVSEIFRIIDKALSETPSEAGIAGRPDRSNRYEKASGVRAESKRRLGGYIDNHLLNNVPYLSAGSVKNTYRVSTGRTLLSFRKLMLRQKYRTDNHFLTFLKESNTLTSSLYTRNPDDSLFLFFTDDMAPVRPLFGSVNLLAGVGQSLAGVFLAPLDGGRALANGVKGVAMSLPELLFFNIRKGSYRYQPYQQLMSANDL